MQGSAPTATLDVESGAEARTFVADPRPGSA
jgi:hypothetical protein